MDPGYIYTSLRHTSREKVPVSVLLRHLAKSPRFPETRKGVGKVDVEEAVVNRELWYKLAHTIVSTRSNVMERRGSGQVLVLLLTWFRLPRREFLGFVRKELGKGWLYDAVMASLQVAFTIKLVRWQTQLEKEVLKEKIGLLVAAAGLMSVFGEFVRRVDDERRGIWIRGISRGIRECYKVAIGCVEVDGGVPDEISTACMGLLASLPFLIRPGDTEGMNDVDWDTVEEIACQYPCWQTRDMAHHTMRKLDVVLRKAGINTNRVAASWKQACVRKQMHPCMVSVVVE
ncbi:hypothetical protein BCR33DRAFT_761497 [Rhizoclosmatium globosum]|uniref:Uncharacterized protein n=1 Tax=Rhizoclosmatium globosum TaxID=329046 RepID=A0A1Y2D1V7_9FUNG|nr:hypothetical protein BCR33DRAFT_761497 [Rhizoclosmatium globosum]|eukprot:ORY53271.1 hypothetical protein BCR33DRAFT_761497 [Rhizoclosmatium globosum]